MRAKIPCFVRDGGGGAKRAQARRRERGARTWKATSSHRLPCITSSAACHDARRAVPVSAAKKPKNQNKKEKSGRKTTTSRGVPIGGERASMTTTGVPLPATTAAAVACGVASARAFQPHARGAARRTALWASRVTVTGIIIFFQKCSGCWHQSRDLPMHCQEKTRP